jgi:hypothetical protein
MASYRFYPVSKTNRVPAPGEDHDFEGDRAALDHAATMGNGQAIEVWQETRFVGLVAGAATQASGSGT